MNNEIKKAFDSLAPTPEQKSRILAGIKKRAAGETGTKPARKGVKWLRVAAVAAALCCVFAMTAFAEEIGGFIAGIFTNDAVVGEEVRTYVYRDTDGHVEMTVEEVLSDNSTIRMVIHYRALDDEGAQWLSTLELYGGDPEWYNENWYFRLSADPAPGSRAAGGMTGAYELEDMRTETERRFVLLMELASDDWGTAVLMKYGMTDGSRETEIDVTGNLEKRVYTLDSVQTPGKPYRPTSVSVTPLTVTVYGENLGAFYYKEFETPYGIYSEIGPLSDEPIGSMSVKFRDGSEMVMFRGGCGYRNMSMFGIVESTPDPDDCMIARTSFDQPIDLDTLSGIEIDGVFYPFD